MDEVEQTLLSVLDFSSSDFPVPVLWIDLRFLHKTCHKFNMNFQAEEKSKLLIPNDDFDGSTISPILYSTLFYEFSNPDKGPSEHIWFFNYIL